MSKKPAEEKRYRVEIRPKSINQNTYVKSIENNDITICTGAAGCGKSFLALATARKLMDLHPDKYKRLVIIRPYMASNTGEKLGALPGELKEKVLPYALAVKDNLLEMMDDVSAKYFLEKIEFTVLSMCRGRSFNNTIVIVEEAQNVPTDGGSFKMLLTRIGHDSKLIIAGDTDQLDIPKEKSALNDAIKRLEDLQGVGIVSLNDSKDIQRNPLIREILERYK